MSSAGTVVQGRTAARTRRILVFPDGHGNGNGALNDQPGARRDHGPGHAQRVEIVIYFVCLLYPVNAIDFSDLSFTIYAPPPGSTPLGWRLGGDRRW